MNGFMVLKIYPNACEIEVCGVCKTGEELDEMIANIGECEKMTDELFYWETRNINLKSLEII